MTNVILLSDTHGFLDDRLKPHLQAADEIWHAGDFGGNGVVERLETYQKPLRGVYGNIDAAELRRHFPKVLQFRCEGVHVGMTHIGGKPGRYQPDARALLADGPPDVLICGHSHILRVERDPTHGNLLFLNPGAAGKEGFHHIQTALRFVVDGPRIRDLAVIEIGKRGTLPPDSADNFSGSGGSKS